MRHRVSGKKLGRTTKQRQALFKNLLVALIQKGRIRTTEAKAKAIRGLADKLVTQAKVGSLHSRRLLIAFLRNVAAVNQLVDKLAPEFKARSSGLTRLVRVGHRRGDGATIVVLEWVTTERAALAPKVKKPIRRPADKKTAPASTPTERQQGAAKIGPRPTGGGPTKTLPRTTHK